MGSFRPERENESESESERERETCDAFFLNVAFFIVGVYVISKYYIFIFYKNIAIILMPR